MNSCFSSKSLFGRIINGVSQWFIVIPEMQTARDRLGQKINFLALYDNCIKTETIDQKIRTVEELGSSLDKENRNLRFEVEEYKEKLEALEAEMKMLKDIIL